MNPSVAKMPEVAQLGVGNGHQDQVLSTTSECSEGRSGYRNVEGRHAPQRLHGLADAVAYSPELFGLVNDSIEDPDSRWASIQSSSSGSSSTPVPGVIVLDSSTRTAYSGVVAKTLVPRCRDAAFSAPHDRPSKAPTKLPRSASSAQARSTAAATEATATRGYRAGTRLSGRD